MPQAREDVPAVILSRLGCYDSEKYSICDASKVIYLIADYQIIECDSTVIFGHDVIVDLQGLTFGLMAQMTPPTIK